MSGRTLLWSGLGAIVVGVLLTIFLIVPTVAAKVVSEYELTPVRPAPVLERWTEGQVTLDARNRNDWVFFDFSRGSVVTDAQRSGLNWDLAFQRYRVMSNSGTSHPGGTAGAIRIEGDAPPAAAPEDGYVVDDWEHGVSHNFAFRRWYRYSPIRAGLEPRKKLWFVVRTADGGYAWLQFLSYHCPGDLGGGHGCVTFRYGYRSDFSRELSAP